MRRKRIRRIAIYINGIVQGVGFRPFVYRLAQRHGLDGWVANGPAGVTIEVQGGSAALQRFLEALQQEAPPLALIASLEQAEIPVVAGSGFAIRESGSGNGQTLVAPDGDVCPDCLEELFDPRDRRYRYPFTNCTNCGPRYSIITATPYDRPNTTMADFPLCKECAAEYHDPANRRFHAQPVACPACGPRLALVDGAGAAVAGDPLPGATAALRAGKIVAIKGVGGYHLAVDPYSSAAVRELRRRKRRDEKPFAMMVESLASAAALAQVSEIEGRFLAGPERPIVLLRKRPGNGIAPEVAPANDYFGIMLPAAPLHYLLLRGSFTALVMTSANLSEEPLIYRDEEALQQLAGIADLFLTHNRRIQAPCDDSVIRVFRRHPLLLRRARGYVPRAIRVPLTAAASLGTGGELKAAICLVANGQAFPGRHLGDLQGSATLDAYRENVAAMERLTGINPQIAGHDLHPDYHSTVFAGTCGIAGKVAVQHHHAHLASCMAENCLEGEVLGVIFDGSGYGGDGTVWGGEFLLGGYESCRRVGRLRHLRLPGGDAAAKEPFRMAISLLYQLDGEELVAEDFACLTEVAPAERKIFLKMLASGMNSPLTSSAGRLFDAAAALIGVRSRMSYEGQAAIELEGLAERGVCRRDYPFAIGQDGPELVLDWQPLFRELLADLVAGARAADVAAGFHQSLALAVAGVCGAIRRERAVSRVVLSGGVFQNRLFSEAVTSLLETAGFTVFTHRLVPPNDGGLALGQAMIAGRSRACA